MALPAACIRPGPVAVGETVVDCAGRAGEEWVAPSVAVPGCGLGGDPGCNLWLGEQKK